MKNIARTLACVATLMLTASAHAQEVKAGDLVITQAWSRATPAGAKVAGGYLTIENKGAAPDRLLSGTGDIAGKVEIRPMMYLALSYDHRIVDGREAVTFLVRVKDVLEDPARLVLDL